MIKEYDESSDREKHIMKSLLGFALFCLLVVGLVKVLGCFEANKPEYPVQIRTNFADFALQVVGLIEKAHDHDLELYKDELPQDAVERLRAYAQNSDETFIANNVHGLYVIVDARAENEYYGCDREIKQVLRSRLMPEIPFPSCR